MGTVLQDLHEAADLRPSMQRALSHEPSSSFAAAGAAVVRPAFQRLAHSWPGIAVGGGRDCRQSVS